MSFSWMDFIVAILFVEAFLHLALVFSGKRFTSLLGSTPKANVIVSIILAAVAVDVYVFTHSFDALFNNGLLIGFIDMYVAYLVFGRWMHKRWFSGEERLKEERNAISVG